MVLTFDPRAIYMYKPQQHIANFDYKWVEFNTDSDFHLTPQCNAEVHWSITDCK